MINTITNTYNMHRSNKWQNAYNHVTTDHLNDQLSLDLFYSLSVVLDKKAIDVTGSDYRAKLDVMINNWQRIIGNNWQIVDIEDTEIFQSDQHDNKQISDKLPSENTADNLLALVDAETLAIKNISAENDRLTEVVTLRFVVYPSDQYIQENAQKETQTADKAEFAVHKNEILEPLQLLLNEYLISLKQAGDQASSNPKFDCYLLPLKKIIQAPKMACFDMDSTLIEQEVIVEIAKATGIGRRVNEITESAMRGEIDFNESFSQRVRLLHGTVADVLDDINDGLTLSAGAQTTLAVLNALGCHTVLLSGGFTYFAKVVAGKLAIKEYHANTLLIEDAKVIGEAQLPIVDGNRKAELVKQIAQEQNIELDDVICVGDGANDLAMMAVANLGIAYRAKPIVQQQADTAINYTGLEGVLYALGFSANDCVA